MSSKYKNLLSPVRVGNVVFKNRMIASRSSPRLVQGAEQHPTEALITHYANKARNGAAVVTCGGVGMPHMVPDDRRETFSRETLLPGMFDIDGLSGQRYLAQLAEAIHFYGGKASMQIGGYVPVKYDVSPGNLSVDIGMNTPVSGEEIPPDVLDEVAEDFVHQAVILQRSGFDMVYLHMAYRLTILGRFLSPLTNQREDKYGGSLENMARFPIMVADRIKQRCGSDFIIEASMSGVEPEGGRTLEDTIALAKLLAGHIDLLQLRAGSIDPAHPTGFNPEPTPFLYMAEAVKKSGAEIAVVTVGGYQDLDASEDIIASGKADFIAMARNWISNPEYGSCAYEGRNEDVVPCIRCNICLGRSTATSVCSVNPIWGLEHKIERMIKPPDEKKKVAVVGGGPAGMKAALIAAGRGHDVTLYEKSGALGGLLKTTDNVSFKWPQRNFKNYLVRQIEKSGVRTLLNMEATNAVLKREKYDVVLAALGSEPVIPRIPGADGRNVISAVNVYGNEAAIAGDVVVVGGGEVGVETGMHLAGQGHKVTVLEMTDTLAAEAPRLHFYSMFREAWERLDNFSYILRARCTGIGADGVTYLDIDGHERSITAGSVVMAVGMKPRYDVALELYGAGAQFFMIGDCSAVGNIQKAIRSAFSIASML